MGYGKVITCSVKDMNKYHGNKYNFAICRKCPSDDPNTLLARYGFYWMPILAPYPELYTGYMTYKKQGMWNQLVFDTWYTPLYNEYVLHNEQTRCALNYIREVLLAGYNVVVCCFCNDINMCHRKLVGQLFEKKGFQAIYT